MPPVQCRSADITAASVAAVALGLLALTALVPVAAAGDAGTGSPAVRVDPGGTAASSTESAENLTLVSTTPRIVELFPNPTAAENRGEYLVVRLPERGNWSLSDGYHEAEIPANASGVVALSMDPANATPLFADETAVAGNGGTGDPTLLALDDHFPLAASGDRVELRRNGTAVAVVEYDRAPEGHRWRASWREWRPRGYAPRSAEATADAAVTPFVLPDSPGLPVEPLRAADDRLLVAGYTLTSERVADTLVAAADRGVTVRVLLEGSPVGGFSTRSAELIDRLTAAGVEVRILDSEVERFRFHHPKYAVADDRAVVLTENWKPSGTGGRSNRGWGAVVGSAPDSERDAGGVAGTDREATVADDLASLFVADFEARDARPWRAFRADTEFHDGGRANGSYPTRFDAPEEPARANVTVLTAPGNAADRIVARVDAADERVLAVVPRVGGPDDRIVRALRRAADRGVDAADERVLAVVPRVGGPDDRIVRALRRAADRGVDVHLLLSDAWYDREANRNLSERLADKPIAVGLAEPRGRFGKVHAKGLVVDDTAVVGSLNWNPSAATNNREVLLAVENEPIADFYARAYAADWRGGGIQLPVGFAAGLGVALAGAGAVARREIAFG